MRKDTKPLTIPEILHNTEGLYEGDLVHYWRFVFRHAHNLENPYHNYRHMLHVFWLCYDACRYYARHPPKKGSLLNTPRDRRNFLIGSILHDFDHQGMKDGDAKNIRAARAGLRLAVLPEDVLYGPLISTFIGATEYPYVVPTEELSLPERILRDADAAQSLSQAWMQQTVFGLAAELGIPPAEMLMKEIEFHGKLKFHTRWAQAAFPRQMIRDKIAETKAYLAML